MEHSYSIWRVAARISYLSELISFRSAVLIVTDLMRKTKTQFLLHDFEFEENLLVRFMYYIAMLQFTEDLVTVKQVYH